jgi:ferrochelatase
MVSAGAALHKTNDRTTTGALVSNLGTPDAPTARAVRRYLREFLADRRVVDLPRALWLPILYGVILPFRPRRSAALYRKIWTESGSPLLFMTQNIGEKLARELQARANEEIPVAIGMRYGSPSLRSALEQLLRRGCSRIIALPLYPQYSGTTTGSTVDAIAGTLRRLGKEPMIQAIEDYHSEPGYIAALSTSVREAWQHTGKPTRLLLSFHGLPKRYANAGDPYPLQCERTAKLLAEALQIDDDRWALSYQSRFGSEEWLKPSTDSILEQWGRQRLDSIDVLCPGFATDCLETLEEIAVTGQEIYSNAGGQGFRYIPALNDRSDHICALADIVLNSVQG